jgi:hypothetical protein
MVLVTDLPPSPHIEIPGPLTYRVGANERRGWILNANRAGVLIASEREENAGTRVVLRIPAIGGEPFDLPAIVTRSGKKQTPIRGLSFALGLQLQGLTETDTQRLGWILESQESKLRISLEQAREFLSADEGTLGAAVLDESSDSPFLVFLGDIAPFERAALTETDPVHLLAREMTLLRAQLGVFRSLLPKIVADPVSQAQVFRPLLEQLVLRSDQAEMKAEEMIRQLAEREDRENRKNLNELSTRLHEPKLDLYREVEKRLAPLASPPWEGAVTEIKERLERVRAARRKSDTDAGYHTPFAKKAAEKKTAAKARMAQRITNLAVFGIPIALTVLAAWLLLLPRFRLSAFDIPLAGITSTLEEDTLVVKTYRGEWHKLSAGDRDKTLRGIQQYMEQKRLRNAKILAEDSRMLAAILYSGGGAQGAIQFTTRMYE